MGDGQQQGRWHAWLSESLGCRGGPSPDSAPPGLRADDERLRDAGGADPAAPPRAPSISSATSGTCSTTPTTAPPPSHGFKVGIGTLASLALYEDLLRRDLIGSTSTHAVASWPAPGRVEERIAAVLGTGELAAKAIEETRAKYPSRADCSGTSSPASATHGLRSRARLRTGICIPFGDARAMLRDAGCPFEPEQIGISRERLRISYEQAYYIRRRYTVLDFVRAARRSSDAALDGLFGPGGRWSGDGGRLMSADEAASPAPRIRHVALDMDGTLYRGKRLFDATLPFLERLRRLGIGYTFLTNNTSLSKADYVRKLRRLRHRRERAADLHARRFDHRLPPRAAAGGRRRSRCSARPRSAASSRRRVSR